MSEKPKPAWWAEFERLVALPVAPIPCEPERKPKRSHRAKGIPVGEGKPLKGVLPKACYRGHLYTPETTGTRVVAGNRVRKCLVCAEQRRNRVIEVVHGTLYAYRRHKCRCDACRRENTETRRRQRLKGETNA